MEAEKRLDLLAEASQYDLACACGTRNGDDHRRRDGAGRWLYPVTVVRGGPGVILKTLMTSHCVNDCAYCPFRASVDAPRCSLAPEEMARLFMDLERRRSLIGIFLSSGVVRTPDDAMAPLVDTAAILRRRYGYRGYIHLKVLPGASDAAVEQAVAWANAVSVNIEVPSARHAAVLSARKRYKEDILRVMATIARLRRERRGRRRVKQTTQFLVGASDETDREIVTRMGSLYGAEKLTRVYFSAYQRGLGRADLPGEADPRSGEARLTREHRLYQVDFLMRQYGFGAEEIPYEPDGCLSAEEDPKATWARRHPEFFPVRIHRAPRRDLLRVPGMGPVTVRRVLEARGRGRIRRLEQLGLRGRRLREVGAHVTLKD